MEVKLYKRLWSTDQLIKTRELRLSHYIVKQLGGIFKKNKIRTMEGYRKLTIKESISFVLNKLGWYVIVPFVILGYFGWYNYNNLKSLVNKEFKNKWEDWKNEW
jgi:hypothetical protein